MAEHTKCHRDDKYDDWQTVKLVMPGLVPGIHVFAG
jgi:hypothetical protein